MLFAVVCICFGAFAQSKVDRVYMQNGEYYEGEIIAIGTKQILIKHESRVFSLNREEVKFVFRSEQARRFATPSKIVREPAPDPIDYFEAIDKRYVTELGGGVYTLVPFAVNMSITGWYGLNDRWFIGLSTSLDFYSAYMLKFSGHGRFFMPVNRALKGYLTAGVGVGPFANYLNVNQDWIEREVSTVVQSSIGTGLWLESGLKIAFTGEIGLAGSFFNVEERYDDGFSQRRDFTTFQVFAPYLKFGMAF